MSANLSMPPKPYLGGIFVRYNPHHFHFTPWCRFSELSSSNTRCGAFFEFRCDTDYSDQGFT